MAKLVPHPDDPAVIIVEAEPIFYGNSYRHEVPYDTQLAAAMRPCIPQNSTRVRFESGAMYAVMGLERSDIPVLITPVVGTFKAVLIRPDESVLVLNDEGGAKQGLRPTRSLIVPGRYTWALQGLNAHTGFDLEFDRRQKPSHPYTGQEPFLKDLWEGTEIDPPRFETPPRRL